MPERFHILVADRNPHVRRFLARELAAAGFEVRVTDSVRRLRQALADPRRPDLVVLDPDLPDADDGTLLAELNDRPSSVPVVLHTFLSDWDGPTRRLTGAAAFVEKGAGSIEELIQVVTRLLPSPAPLPPSTPRRDV